ncbi:hypothetical protein GCM10027614_68780 [Micromonospora vulcania]
MTEQNTWFGWPLVLLSVVALVLLVRRSLAARIVAVLIVVFTVAAIGPRVRFNGVETGVDGPWSYVPDDLPLVEMMMPTRLTLVVAAAVGVLLALAWDAASRAQKAPRRRWLRPVGYAAITLAVLPLFPGRCPPSRSTRRRTSSPPAAGGRTCRRVGRWCRYRSRATCTACRRCAGAR